jgi:hypothetical protein
LHLGLDLFKLFITLLDYLLNTVSFVLVLALEFLKRGVLDVLEMVLKRLNQVLDVFVV